MLRFDAADMKKKSGEKQSEHEGREASLMRGFLVDAFHGVLNREPDPVGLEAYLKQVLSGVISIEDVLRYFCSLNEFYVRVNPKDRDRAISLLYGGGGEAYGNASLWNERQESLVFFHFPKTGGVSFTITMAKFFHPLQLGQAGPRRIVAGYDFGKYQKLFAYHMDWGQAQAVPGPKAMLTCLREPTSRLLSLLAFLGDLNESAVPPYDKIARLASGGSIMDVLRAEDPAVRNYFDNVYVRHLADAYIQGDGVDPLKENPKRVLQLALDRLFGMSGFYFLEDVAQNEGHVTGAALLALQHHAGRGFDGKLVRENVSKAQFLLSDLSAAEQKVIGEAVALDREFYRIAYEHKK